MVKSQAQSGRMRTRIHHGPTSGDHMDSTERSQSSKLAATARSAGKRISPKPSKPCKQTASGLDMIHEPLSRAGLDDH